MRSPLLVMLRSLSLLSAGLLVPLAASAQPMQTDAAPAAQALRLSSGAEGSASFSVRAVSESGVPDCPGYVDPSAPDVALDWGGGNLRVWVRAGFDATLLVHGPGGWACNDDAEGTSPVVQVSAAPAGRYAVWIGSFEPSPEEPAATLYAGSPPPPPVLASDDAPLAGVVTAVGGFEDAQGAIEVNVQAGGPDRAQELETETLCTGYINTGQPTAAIDYTAAGGTGTLVIAAASPDTDPVLVVRGPDGSVWCNDDYGGSDSVVQVEGAEGGRYAVWVGTFSVEEGTMPATLIVSETPRPSPEDFFIDEPSRMGVPYSEGTYTVLNLGASPRARLTLDGDDASADVSVSTTVSNPVRGDACSGYLEPGPTASLTIRGDGPVAITASADLDLVMVVRTPGGAWFCSDDADNLNPGIQIDTPEAGTYSVWAGSFSDTGEATAVTVTAARSELVVSQPEFGPEPIGADPQSEGTYAGTELQSGQPAATLSLGETIAVRPGGPILNPVEGTACGGFVSSRPTAEFQGTADGAVVSASASADLTLVVRAPDGFWSCSDDADGSDPQIIVEGPEGTYSVWVGTFSRLDSPPDAELSVTPGE